MNCGKRVERTETYTKWCRSWRKWFRCKRTRTTIYYEYTFTHILPKASIFGKVYQGCCDGVIYQWRNGWFPFEGVLNRGVWNAVRTPQPMLFKDELKRIGPCDIF